MLKDSTEKKIKIESINDIENFEEEIETVILTLIQI